MRSSTPVTSLNFHAKALGGTLLILAGMGGVGMLMRAGGTPAGPPAIIVLEHAHPLTLSVAFSMHLGERTIDIDQDKAAETFLSVPSGWQRTEVRHAPLSEVRPEAPAMGFVRWRLPPGAGVSFRARGTWKQIQLRNPSDIPMRLRITRVDLETGNAAHDTFLVQSQAVTAP